MKLVNVMDKAGAYALQEHPEMLIRSVSGDPENVIGLPYRAIETLQYLLALRQKIHKG
jgi:septum formation protein